MKKLRIRSINTLVTAIISIILFLAMAGLVTYVTVSSYENTLAMATENMTTVNGNLVASVNDLIDSTVGLVKVLALEGDVRDFLQGKGDVKDFLKNQFKVHKGLNSIYLVNTEGVVPAGYTFKGSDMTGLNLADRRFVKEGLAGRECVMNEIVKSRSTGEYSFIVSAPVRDEAGKILGVAAVGIDWQNYLNEHVLPIRLGAHGYAYMLDAKGRFIAHPDKELVLQDSMGLDFVKETLARQKGTLGYTYNGQKKIQVFDQVKRTGWIVCASAIEDDLTAVATHQRQVLLAGCAAAYVLLLASILILLRKQIVLSLRSIIAFSAEIARGNYKASLDGSFRFEMRDLADNIQRMTDELKHKLGFSDGVLNGITSPMLICDNDVNVRFLNRQLLHLLGKPGLPENYLGQHAGVFFYDDPTRPTVSAQTLREGKALEMETETTTGDGSKRFVKVDSSPISDLDGRLIGAITIITDITGIRNQSMAMQEQNRRLAETARAADAISDRLATAADELASQIEEASRGTEHQKERLNETSSAVEQMSSSVIDVARNSSEAARNANGAKERAENGEQVVGKAVAAFRKVESSTLAMKGQVEDLSQRASGIGSIMQIIEDIADQTNLLALNAAIEAARAGDAGRGFAVVADEVRKLAEKTMGATKDVGMSIKEIQESIATARQHMDEAGGLVADATSLSAQSGKALQEIVLISDQSAAQIQAIAAAAEQQSAASEQISKSAEEVSMIAAETATTMGHSAQAVSDLARMAGELKEIIGAMQV